MKRFLSLPASLLGMATPGTPASTGNTLPEPITPAELDHQLGSDQAVISTLKGADDDGTLPRKTEFFFYWERKALEGLVAVLRPRGFVLKAWRSNLKRVIVERDMPADYATLKELTPELLKAAHRFGVRYDGWEAFVVRQRHDVTAAKVTKH